MLNTYGLGKHSNLHRTSAALPRQAFRTGHGAHCNAQMQISSMKDFMFLVELVTYTNRFLQNARALKMYYVLRHALTTGFCSLDAG